MSFTGKKVLITGGTTGIGRATAEMFIAQGADVAITGRNPKTLDSAKRELEGKAWVIESDAADPTAIDALVKQVSDKWGKIDILFLNAGVAQFAPISDLSIDQWDTMFSVNVKGPWYAVKAALPHINDGARIIFNTSVAQAKGMSGASIYGPTKAALRSMVRVLAAELAEKNILVNSVSPGPIETPIYGKLGFDKATLDGFAESISQSVPLQRFGSPQEVAHAVLFLAGPGGSYITGVDLPVDGGFGQV